MVVQPRYLGASGLEILCEGRNAKKQRQESHGITPVHTLAFRLPAETAVRLAPVAVNVPVNVSAAVVVAIAPPSIQNAVELAA